MSKSISLVFFFAFFLCGCDWYEPPVIPRYNNGPFTGRGALFGNVPFRTIATKEARVDVDTVIVLRTFDQWNAFWAEFESGSTFVNPKPDFDHDMVVFLTYGFRAAGCPRYYQDLIHSIRLTEEKLIVKVNPLPELGTCQAEVWPQQHVVVDRYPSHELQYAFPESD